MERRAGAACLSARAGEGAVQAQTVSGAEVSNRRAITGSPCMLVMQSAERIIRVSMTLGDVVYCRA